eukprot:1177173-Prorocentrum_minimum.AAC.4
MHSCSAASARSSAARMPSADWWMHSFSPRMSFAAARSNLSSSLFVAAAEVTPEAGTNQRREKRTYPRWGPIGGGTGGYTRGGDPSEEGREDSKTALLLARTFLALGEDLERLLGGVQRGVDADLDLVHAAAEHHQRGHLRPHLSIPKMSKKYRKE